MAKKITPEAAMKLIRDAENRGYSEWVREARENYELYNGYHWNEKDMQIMRHEKRPTIAFNEAATLIDAFVGSEIQNRKEIKYYPRQDQNFAESDGMQSISMWVRQSSNQERSEIDAEKDMCITGIGCTETRMDYSDSELGDLDISRVCPLDLRWDIDARAKNLTDRKWDAKFKILTREEILDIWPDAELDETGAGVYPQTDLPTQGHIPITYNHGNSEVGRGKKGFKVWDFQYFLNEPYYKMDNPFMQEPEMFQLVLPDLMEKIGPEVQSQVMNLSEDGFNAIKKLVKQLKLQMPEYARLTKKVYYKMFFIDTTGEILQDGDNAIDGFTRQFITGKRDEKDGTWYGLMRPLKDPQLYLNKILSSVLYTYMANSKGGVFVRDDAIVDFEEFKAQYANPAGIMRLTDLDGVREKDKADIGSAAPQLIQLLMTSIPKLGGMNPEMLAAQTGDRTNALVQTRIQQSLTMVAEFIDSMTAYRINWGKMLIQFTKNYLCQEERIMRLNTEEGMEFINLMQDPLADDYDVIAEEGPISMNQRIEIWQVLSQAFQGQPLPPPLLKFLPVPKPVIAETIQYMQQMSQNPAQEAQQQADVELTKAETQKSLALAGNTQARTAKVMADTEKTVTDNEINKVQQHFNPPQMANPNPPQPEAQNFQSI